MKVFVCLAAVLCVVSGGYIAGPAVVRAPSFDSAVIKSDRLGGNFAYSTAEAHAYAAVNPIVQNVVSPVGVSYSAHTVAAPVAVAAPAVAYAAPAVAPVAYAAPAVAHVAAAPYGYAAHLYR